MSRSLSIETEDEPARESFELAIIYLEIQQKKDILHVMQQYKEVLTYEEKEALKAIEIELNNLTLIVDQAKREMNQTNIENQGIQNDEANDKDISSSLKNMVKPLFQILSGIISLYFIWLSSAGLLNKITQGFLFKYVSWAKMLFYFICFITCFYFFVTEDH